MTSPAVPGLTAAVLLAAVDPGLSPIDRTVLAAVADWPAHTEPTLDRLSACFPLLPRELVFAAVARLEDRGYLPCGVIR